MCTLYSTGPFPGSFHLLSLPVCMQIWKGRPGNLVASDRQRVDTWGWCPTKDLEALCCNVRPIVGCQSVHKAASYCSLLMTGGHVAGIIMVRHRLLCVYPQLSDITACDQLSQAFLIHICILQAIKEWWWEWPGNEASMPHNGCCSLDNMSPTSQILVPLRLPLSWHGNCVHCNRQMWPWKWLLEGEGGANTEKVADTTNHPRYNPALWTCRTCSLSESDLWCPAEN